MLEIIEILAQALKMPILSVKANCTGSMTPPRVGSRLTAQRLYREIRERPARGGKAEGRGGEGAVRRAFTCFSIRTAAPVPAFIPSLIGEELLQEITL